MEELFDVIAKSINQFTFLDILDILLVAVIIYGLIRITSKTRAIQVLKGLGVIIVVAQISTLLGLTTVTWILNYLISAGAILLVILFQPEIRRALERIGRGKLLDISFSSQATGDEDRIIEEAERAILNMSIRKVGALMVFEHKTGLRDVIESGIVLNADITSQIIENVFFPNTPLHDGAMIIRGDKIVAAGCFLPLSDNKQIASELGTRHRAALGISELSDADIIIVSEETGVISLAHEGTLTRYLDRKMLREKLEDIFLHEKEKSTSIGSKLARKAARK